MNKFQTFPDKRTGNAVTYQLPVVLKAAFAMFSLKAPSLLDFKTQTTAEENNLHNIYRIQGEIPSDNQIRGILDPISPLLLRPLFRSLFERLSQAGLIGQYHYRNKAVIVSADGVEHFSSTIADFNRIYGNDKKCRGRVCPCPDWPQANDHHRASAIRAATRAAPTILFTVH